MTTANTNNRASLLAGLRTGGVRSSTLETPLPSGSFNLRRHSSFAEADDQVNHMFHQSISQDRDVPMTAAVDGSINRFSHHQAMNPNSIPFTPAFTPNIAPQAQVQMQILQLEMMRIQAMQAQQQYQEIMAQATIQQHLQTQGRERRTSLAFNPPVSAGPMSNSFDLRAATLSAQMRRANQTDQIKSQLAFPTPSDDHLPMTAALGGRLSGRTISGSLHTRFDEHSDLPLTPNSTTVISGGTFLGNPPSNTSSPQVATPSKSDSASSWRRSGNNNSVLGANRVVSSPSLKVTPPPSDEDHVSPFFALGGLKSRPQPLRFSSAVSQSLSTVAIDTTDDDTDGETHSSSSSERSIASNSAATTPRSATSNEMPLSPREEASKRLYEGLGIGRPVSSTPSDGGYPHLTVSVSPGRRMVSQPTRQPRGPPSGDELGPKNFATRIRRQAIGGLGVLMGARERREVVEAY